MCFWLPQAEMRIIVINGSSHHLTPSPVRLYEGPDSAEGLVDFARRMHARDDGTVNFLLAGGDDEESPARESMDQTPEDEALEAILHEEL